MQVVELDNILNGRTSVGRLRLLSALQVRGSAGMQYNTHIRHSHRQMERCAYVSTRPSIVQYN